MGSSYEEFNVIDSVMQITVAIIEDTTGQIYKVIPLYIKFIN